MQENGTSSARAGCCQFPYRLRVLLRTSKGFNCGFEREKTNPATEEIHSECKGRGGGESQ